MLIRFCSDSQATFWAASINYSECWSSRYNLVVSHLNNKVSSNLWGFLKISVIREFNILHSSHWEKNI